MKTENAVDSEAVRLSPWGARMASLHEQPLQERGAACDQRPRTKGQKRQSQKTRNRDEEQQGRARRDNGPPTGG